MSKRNKPSKDKRRQELIRTLPSLPSLPEWALLLKSPADKIMAGSYKNVYIYGKTNIAISIEENIAEERLQHRTKIYTMLETLSDCNVNYPSQYIAIGKYFISRLRYCPMGDLFDNMDDITDMETYEDLFRTYYKLHEIGIYHIDVKPENLLVCNCGGKVIIAVADIEDALLNTQENGIIAPLRVVRTRPYAPYNAIQKGKKYGFSRDLLSYCDYYAVSFIMLIVYTWTIEGRSAESTNLVYDYQNSSIIPDDYLKLKTRAPESVNLAVKTFNTGTHFSSYIVRRMKYMYGEPQKPLKQRVKNFFRGMMGYAQKLKI